MKSMLNYNGITFIHIMWQCGMLGDGKYSNLYDLTFEFLIAKHTHTPDNIQLFPW